VLGSILTLGAWGAIAHNSGAGWVQALGAILAGFLAVGLVVPAFAVRLARCHVVNSPTDGTVGEPVAVELAVSRPLRVRLLVPPGPETVTGNRSVCLIEGRSEHRGVMTHCVVVVASAAPFGLLWWSKKVLLPLSHPLHVAPRRGEPDDVNLVQGRSAGEDRRRVSARVGEPRGVRQYRPGDLRHWVHWPATAHTGSLMVREMEQPTSRPVTVRVPLSGGHEAAERQAERALGTVSELLAAGQGVILLTGEPGGVVSERVDSAQQAGRRLARAVPIPADAGLR